MAVFDGDKRVDSLTGEFVSDTDNSSFGNGVVLNKGCFNLGG